MRLCVIVPFLNEERFLPRVLASIAGQTRAPDLVVLVDDGSTDGSVAIAEAFAARSGGRVLRRPRQERVRDRLAAAAEYTAFLWALSQLGERYDVVAKLDADIELTRDVFSTIVQRMQDDPTLGIAGSYTTEAAQDGQWRREAHPPEHVRGGTKYYRMDCLDVIGPVPAILGWDTIDDARARMHGWRTQSLAIPSGDPRHLRASGLHDGVLRAHRRWGRCAWGYGASFPYVVAWAAGRALRRPRLGSLHYVAGYISAALSGAPRAEKPLRRHVRREGRDRLLLMVRELWNSPRDALAARAR